MKTIIISQRQFIEHNRFNDIKKSWKLSLDYSKILYDNINKHDVLDMIENTYNQYIQSLKSNKIYKIKNKNNNIMVWESLVNTCKKSKYDENFKKFCIKQLYYTSLKKYNNF